MIPKHKITAVINGRRNVSWHNEQEVGNFISYSFEESMMGLACPFSMTLPFSQSAWDLCKPDRPIQILVDGVPKLNGYLEERELAEDAETITLTGRDRSGRLVDDCAPGVNFSGLGIVDITTKLVQPWGFAPVFDNARNRSISLGRGKKARGTMSNLLGKSARFNGKLRVLRGDDESLRLNSKVGTQIEPGQTRAQVLTTLAVQAGYMMWMSVDGTQIIVGEPDYDQDTQFSLVMPKKGSSTVGSVTGMGWRDSTGDRYSHIMVVGSGTGTDANYGGGVAARRGDSYNNPDDPDGIGIDFTAPKRLILTRSVSSQADAQEEADREMARRDALGQVCTVRAPGHGQIYSGTVPTLFAPDTLALVLDERIQRGGIYIITKATFQSNRKSGEETILTLVKSGSVLTQK